MSQYILEDYNQVEKANVIAEDTDKGERTYKLRGVFGWTDRPNKNKRIYWRSIMEGVINELQEDISKGGFVGELDHPCLTDKNFDILTKEGWKSFEEIKVGERVLTLNKDSQFEYKEVKEKIDQPYQGKAYHFKGRNIDSTFTGDHRFYLEDRNGRKEIAKAKEIFSNRKKYNKHKIIKTGTWVGNGKEKVEIPGTEIEPDALELDAKAFFSFMGIYLSEGSIRHSEQTDNSIVIHQNEGKVADEIRELLKELPFEVKEYYKKRESSVGVSFSIRDERLNAYLRNLGNVYEKYIPFELKQYDAKYLEELIEWFIKGDGRNYRGMYGGNRVNVFSVSKKLIEDLHELVVKIGGSGNWTEHETTEDYMFANHLIEAKNKSTLYQLNISTTKGIYLDERFLEIEEIEHDGNIYSIHVDGNENYYMKQNGKAFLTGNSSPKVNVEKISHKITKLRLAEDGAIVGEVVPTSNTSGQTLKSLMKDGIRVGVSTRGVGAVKPHDGKLGEGLVEVQPGYRMKAIDVVFDPSAGAFPDPVVESYDEESGMYFAVPSNFKTIWNEVFSK